MKDQPVCPVMGVVLVSEFSVKDLLVQPDSIIGVGGKQTENRW